MFESILGAGIGLIGNMLGMNAAGDEADDARAFQLSQMNRNEMLQREFWEKNAALQREFAQSGIRWRVADAQAAGIHPLFALGGGGAAASPTAYVGSDASPVRDNSHQYLGQMGQDIGRAISATSTKNERTGSMLTALGLERAQLENDLLKAQIAKTTGQIGPPMPTMSAGPEHGMMEWKPPEITTQHPGDPSSSSGPAMPYNQWLRAGNGLVSQPAPGLKTEDEFGAPLMTEWLTRNRLGPSFGSTDFKPPLATMQREFPGAIDSRWSIKNWKWVPVYPPPGRVIRSGEPIEDDGWAGVGRTALRHYGGQNPPRQYYGSEGF